MAVDLSGDGRADLLGQGADGAWWLLTSTAVGFLNEKLENWGIMQNPRDLVMTEIVLPR